MSCAIHVHKSSTPIEEIGRLSACMATVAPTLMSQESFKCVLAGCSVPSKAFPATLKSLFKCMLAGCSVPSKTFPATLKSLFKCVLAGCSVPSKAYFLLL